MALHAKDVDIFATGRRFLFGKHISEGYTLRFWYDTYMIEFIAYLACGVLAALSLFQTALIFGAPIGHFAWGGTHRVLPMKLRIGSVVAVLLYGLFAVFILNKAGLMATLSAGVTNVGVWAMTGYFALGIGMNAISRSKPERIVMTPVALVLAVLFLVASLS